jgi:predicted Fe-Mo cluster-binding NifX family protein
MTTLAVPLLGDYVAPRFCSAAEFLVVRIADDGETTAGSLRPTARSWPELLDELVGRGVELLLCNGFNRDYLAPAAARGLKVRAGLGGDARELVRLYLRGELERARIPFGPGRGYGGRGRGRGRGGGRGAGRGTGRGRGRGTDDKPYKGDRHAW